MSTIQEKDDIQLLRDFVERGSQQAFREVMERHLNFVYSVCRREVHDSTLAEDVVQTVFLLLARKAATLREGTVLVGWLFKAARFAASDAMRAETRRRAGEREVIEGMMHRIEQDNQGEIWGAIEPLLNAGIAGLADRDREAVLLRYFENKSLKEVGRLLGISEDTAQKRVSRATEKLKGHLRRHGVVVPVGVLAALLSEQAVQAAPATCGPAVAQVVFKAASVGGHATGVAGSTAGGAPTATVTLKGVLIAMLAKKSIVGVVILLLVGSGITVQRYRAAALVHPEKEACYANLKEISAALMEYRKDHNGRLPRDLVPSRFIKETETLYPRYIKSKDVFVCATDARFRSQHGNRQTWPYDQPVTYEYEVAEWVREEPFGRDRFRSQEFYDQIVPEQGNRIRLVRCNQHHDPDAPPENQHVFLVRPKPYDSRPWAIMWDGSIHRQTWLYDQYFGRWKRYPDMVEQRERIRKRGGKLPEDLPAN